MKHFSILDHSRLSALRSGSEITLTVSLIFVFASSIPIISESIFQPSFALPEYFVNSLFVENLDTPTAMEFAPDGRLFITEKEGKVRIAKNGVLLSTPFLPIPVRDNGERGLNGITLDPDFEKNGFVYIYYTSNNSPLQNKVSRFTANPSNQDIALAGSQIDILNLDNLGSSSNHNGGALHFGDDGKLYVAVGDNNNSSKAQSLSSHFGKILRINSDGSIPSDNPFYNTSGAKKEIWALGLRNPFTFAVSDFTNRMYINDVGKSDREEINSGIAGANYGWPKCEGKCSPSNSNYVDPIYDYNHGSGGAAITGGVFYESNQFPSEYFGSYFFGDYVKGFIKRMDQNNTVYEFDTSTDSPVDIDVGPDGSIYYLSIGDDEVRKIQYVPDNYFPQAKISAVPISGNPPLTVNFSGAQSTDPDPGTNLTYSWNFGDGSPTESGVAVTHTYYNFGAYVVTLTVNDGDGGTNSKKITIELGNPPIGTISSPLPGTKYNEGDVIFFEGYGTDSQNGSILPASAFKWIIRFHHNTHTHPFLEFNGVKNGNFVIPKNHDNSLDVWYRIHLITTNSVGLSRTITTNIYPAESCFVPKIGNMFILNDCTLEFSTTAPGNVFIQNKATLTIPNGVNFDIDFEKNYLDVRSGASVVIKKGGSLR